MDVRLPDGTVISNVPDNISRAELTSRLAKNGYDVAKLDAPKAPAKGFGEVMNETIAGIPRQVGLTARHGIEGVGEVLDFMSSPIRAGLNAVLPKKAPTITGLVTGDGQAKDAIQPGAGRYLADKLGLPKPANANERIAGDATRLMAGGAVPVGLASRGAEVAGGVTKNVLQTLAANPLAQTVSAGSSGLAGGYVRETGGDSTSQLIASLAAGVAAPMALNKAQQAAGTVNKLAQAVSKPSQEQIAQIDMRIDTALRDSGMRMADLPYNVQMGIRQDVHQALNGGGVLSPDAVRRLADYRLIGATPTAATVTLDPAAVSQQKNLAKLGINSKDVNAQRLGQVENSNNRLLIDKLNEVGAATPENPLAGGKKVMDALSNLDASAKARINARYEAARATTGRSAALDPASFAQNANNALDEALLGGKLPGDVRNLLNKVAAGEMPLTVDVAEQFKTRIGDLQRATTDMAERKALGLVRQSLDNTPLLDGQGQQAIDAFNKARRLNRAYMQAVEKTPALQAVRDGMEPDKFVQQFIVGNGGKSNVADVQALWKAVRGDEAAMGAVKEQVAAHLKRSALGGSADEVGNFSQSAYNKALNAIGEDKLRLFFNPDELSQLKAVGRVASYEQFQPKGSAVNNSNTAGTGLAALLDRIGSSPLLSKIPLGSALATPAQNVSVGMRSNQAMNIPNALTQKVLAAQRPPANMLLSPAALMVGDDREQNSLLPRP